MKITFGLQNVQKLRYRTDVLNEDEGEMRKQAGNEDKKEKIGKGKDDDMEKQVQKENG